MQVNTIRHKRRFFSGLKVLLPVLLINGGLSAHPFDQRRADSNSYFRLTRQNVALKIKFPVHAYVNLWVKSIEEYDNYAAHIETEKEKEKVASYLEKCIKIYNEKERLKMIVKNIEFEKELYSTDEGPQYITAELEFKESKDLGTIIITNTMFKEIDVSHNGRAEIEYKNDVYDFVFNKNNYFKLKLK